MDTKHEENCLMLLISGVVATLVIVGVVSVLVRDARSSHTVATAEAPSPPVARTPPAPAPQKTTR